MKRAYVNLTTANTNSKKCDNCDEKIPQGRPFLYFSRTRHTYHLCGKCLVVYATLAVGQDPDCKGDAVGELIGMPE